MKLIKILIIIVISIISSAIVLATNCPGALKLNFITSHNNIDKYVNATLQISDTSLGCSGGGTCWDGYTYLNISYPLALSLNSTWDNRSIVNTANIYKYNISGNVFGSHTINLSFNGTYGCDLNLTLNITSPLSDPNITISLDGLAPILNLNQNYAFNVSFTNVGNGSAINLTGEFSLGDNNKVNLSDNSFVTNSTSNSFEFIFQNITLNTTYLFNLTTLEDTNNINLSLSTILISYVKADGSPGEISRITNNANVTFKINSPPTLIQPLPDIILFQNQTYEIPFVAYFSDPEDGNNLTITVSGNNTITVLINSTFNNATITAPGNTTGYEMINFTATDSLGSIIFDVMNVTTKAIVPTEICNGLDDDGDWDPVYDTGSDGFFSINEPGYNNTSNLDPNGDDYFWWNGTIYNTTIKNINGSEMNGQPDVNETYVDEGLDGEYNNGTHYGDESCINGVMQHVTAYAIVSSSNGGGGGPGPTLTPGIKITDPEDDEEFLINTEITFRSLTTSLSGVSYSWTFGDGASSTDSSPKHTYTKAGTYTVKVTATTDTDTYSDTISITIVGCFEDSHCSNGNVCCGNVCQQEVICTSDDQCQKPDPIINEQCVNPGNSCKTYPTQPSYCSWDECTIQCTSNLDCDDLDPRTDDLCQNSNSCSSSCQNPAKTLEITITSPIPTTYTTRNINLEWDTNLEVDCSYQLNNGNTIHLFSKTISLQTKEGSNKVTVFCEDQQQSVNFQVDTGDGGVFDDTDGDSNILDDLQGNTTGMAFDIFGQPITVYSPTDEQLRYTLNEIISLQGIGIKKYLTIKEGQSTISVLVKNPLLVKVNDIKVRETIPKAIINNTSYLSSPFQFEVVEQDPVIEFLVDALQPNQEFTLTYTINKTLNRSEFETIFSNITDREINQSELDEILRLQKATMEATKITKRIKQDKDSTTITATFDPKRVLKDVDIYLEIPKCMAEKLNEMFFSDDNFRIISDDPLIVWHFEEISEKVDLEYGVFKNISIEDCEDQAVIFAVAKEIEDNIIKKEGNILKTLLPLLFIPLVGIILIYFSRFSEVLVSGKPAATDAYISKLSGYIVSNTKSGHTRKEILKVMQHQHIPKSQIKRAFRKAGRYLKKKT